MNKPQYRKGNIIAWTGFLLVVVPAILEAVNSITPIGASGPLLPWVTPLVSIFSILRIVGIVAIIWGAILALKSKNRSWTWIFLLIPLNIIGLIIVFALGDKSQPDASLVQSSGNPTIKDYIQQSRATGMTDIAITEELKKTGWSEQDIANSLK